MPRSVPGLGTERRTVTDMDWHPIRSAEDNPKESGEYLVTKRNRRGELVMEIWFYAIDEFGKDWMDETGLESKSPVAWMPLPAPYRPDGKA